MRFQWTLRNTAGSLLLIAFMGIAFACSGPKNDARIKWQPVKAERVRELCANPYAGGCVKMDESGCTIITQHVPLNEFTGFNHDMQSPVWVELSHELMHCLGYDHAPTPK